MVDTAAAIAQAGQTGGTQMRVGVVKAFDGQTVTVDVGGGTLVGMPYLRSYQPLAGDSVLCLNAAGGVWSVVGAMAGNPTDNVVANPTFENDTLGSAPANWGVYHDPSSDANGHQVIVRAVGGAFLEGKQSMQVEISDSSGVGFTHSVDHVYSNPFPVVPGERWTAAAWFRFDAGVSLAFLPAHATVGVYMSWHANNTDVPPTVVGTTAFAAVGPNGSTVPWTFLPASYPATGNVVPGGATFGRVVLSSTVYVSGPSSISGTLLWDRIIARRLP